MIILDGKAHAKARKEQLEWENERDFSYRLDKEKPKLVVIMVGDNEASAVYVKHKTKIAKQVGIDCQVIHAPASIKPMALINKIKELNKDKTVHAILLQLPLPEDLNEDVFLQTIDPDKDVDGLHPYNQGRLLLNHETIEPCTPKGVISLLKEYKIDISGKNITIVGTSILVGKPLGFMLFNLGANVTFCNKATTNIKEHTLKADILISATGQQFIITEDMVKKNAVVIDIGIIHDKKTGKLVGDVDFEQVKNKAKFITPVPGGVGPMTIISLVENTKKLYYQNRFSFDFSSPRSVPDFVPEMLQKYEIKNIANDTTKDEIEIIDPNCAIFNPKDSEFNFIFEEIVYQPFSGNYYQMDLNQRHLKFFQALKELKQPISIKIEHVHFVFLGAIEDILFQITPKNTNQNIPMLVKFFRDGRINVNSTLKGMRETMSQDPNADEILQNLYNLIQNFKQTK